jgi:hypothetical protein
MGKTFPPKLYEKLDCYTGCIGLSITVEKDHFLWEQARCFIQMVCFRCSNVVTLPHSQGTPGGEFVCLSKCCQHLPHRMQGLELLFHWGMLCVSTPLMLLLMWEWSIKPISLPVTLWPENFWHRRRHCSWYFETHKTLSSLSSWTMWVHWMQVATVQHCSTWRKPSACSKLTCSWRKWSFSMTALIPIQPVSQCNSRSSFAEECLAQLQQSPGLVYSDFHHIRLRQKHFEGKGFQKLRCASGCKHSAVICPSVEQNSVAPAVMSRNREFVH